ncbi:cell wall-binding repeat-containing protein [[Clostridium] dakarense]|uniref:cell wall-binding repeat-containing protein n=1 Tax=Faecalimicrobium dakarense TaxID=1301100 RepID=UPI0004B4DA46|nr:cell wall-binding repeat-containing protein [[Clostridium] dakarense]
MKRSKLVTSALSIALFLSIMPKAHANEIESYAIENKLVGANRYSTAVEVSKKGWSKANQVVIVNSSSIVDALSVTPFAKLIDAPILLTGKDSLDNTTKEALKNLGTNKVHIIGSTGVISDNVASQLESMGITTNRIGGVNRHDTALKIANEINKIKDVSEIAVVNGYKGLSDAVSIASTAASKGMVILPASPNKGISDFEGFIKDADIKKSYIIGSTSAVSEQIENKVPNPERLGGSNRNETNAKVISKFYTSDKLNNVFVAKNGMNREDQLIDALAVGVLAAKESSPVLIVGNNLSSSQKTLFTNKSANTITQVGSGGNENAFNELKVLQSNSNKPNESNIMYVTNLDEGQPLNVRADAIITSNKIGELYKGDKVEVLEKYNTGWVKIKFNNGVGYVSGSYLTSKAPEENNENVKIKYVNATGGLNVRKGPSTGDAIIGRLSYGDRVEQVEMFSTGWVKIKFEGSYGYVSNDYLSVNPVK